MAIALNDFVTILKREGRYGTPSITNDQITADILASINMRGARIWAAADWKWYRELLTFTMVSGTKQYAVLVVSGNPIDRIQTLIPYDATGAFLSGVPLTERTIQDFYTFCPLTPGTPTDYYNLGIDANGAWNVILSPVPNITTKIGGYAKTVLATYTNADVVANVAIKYFPNAVVLDALFAGCMIDINLIQGMTPDVALAKEQAWEKKIQALIKEQLGVATDNTPPRSPRPVGA